LKPDLKHEGTETQRKNKNFLPQCLRVNGFGIFIFLIPLNSFVFS
jgi:hypothetical protein